MRNLVFLTKRNSSPECDTARRGRVASTCLQNYRNRLSAFRISAGRMYPVGTFLVPDLIGQSDRRLENADQTGY